MKTFEMLLLAVALALAPAMAAAEPADVAVAAEGRSLDNVKLDQSRKPAELLGFLGLEKGIRGNTDRFVFRFRKPD